MFNVTAIIKPPDLSQDVLRETWEGLTDEGWDGDFQQIIPVDGDSPLCLIPDGIPNKFKKGDQIPFKLKDGTISLIKLN